MITQFEMLERLSRLDLLDETRELVMELIEGIIRLAEQVSNANSDSNSLGGILIYS